MQPDVQRVLSGLVRRGALRTDDALACVREGQETGESPLSIAVRRGLVARDEMSRALAANYPNENDETLDLPSSSHAAGRAPPPLTPPPTPMPTPQPATTPFPGAPPWAAPFGGEGDRRSGSNRFVRPATGAYRLPGAGTTPASGSAKFFGPYELIRPLGEGGMGVVYEARDTRLGRRVALKVLHADRLLSRSTLARFEQEARSAAKLKHPNVCPVFEVGNLNGIPYYTMELVPGVSVAALAAAGVHWRRVCEVIRDAARGLQHAHDRGIVHRDVKPSNILIDDAGRGRLVDFGLALDAELDDKPDRLTRSGQFMGTPFYLAPECLEKGSKSASSLSDVYALGVTLYEAISGEQPFRGATTFQLFQEILGGNPKPPRLPAGTPQDVAIVALRALARDPARRYQTAEAVADDLDRILNGQPVVGRPPTIPEFMRTITRRPAFVSGVAATIAVLSLLVVVYVRVIGGPVRPPPQPPPAPPPPPPPVVPNVPVPPPSRTEKGASAAFVADARNALWLGDINKARAAYKQALAIDPKNGDAILEDILAASFVHDYTAGANAAAAVIAHKDNPACVIVAEAALVPDLETGVNSSEDNEYDLESPVGPLLRAVRANHFLETSDQRGGDATLLARAEAMIREGLRQRPRCGLLATVLADVLIRTDKADKAIHLLDEDRDYLGVSESMRWFSKGNALMAKESWLDADATLKRVKDPPYALFARGARATIWAKQGDAAAAIAVYERSEPCTVSDWVIFARCQIALDKETEARRALDAAIKLAEDGGDPLGVFRALGRSPEDCALALTVRRQPEALVSGGAEARGLRARLAARRHDFDRAEEDVAKLRDDGVLPELEKAGIDVSAVRTLRRVEEAAANGTIALEKNLLADAKRFFAAALEDSPDEFPADAHLDRSRLLEAAGDRAGAIAACTSASSSDPTLGPIAKARIAELRRER